MSVWRLLLNRRPRCNDGEAPRSLRKHPRQKGPHQSGVRREDAETRSKRRSHRESFSRQREDGEEVMPKPAKGKAMVKVTASGKRVSYGQAGEAKGGGPRVRPGTSKGDAYCARSMGQMRDNPKAAADPNSPLRLSRKRWKCSGERSQR